MKKILIVIQDMKIGGAQKSLLSFLRCLSASAQQAEYEISLLTIQPEGSFYDALPRNIRRLPVPAPLYWMGAHFSLRLLRDRFSLRGIWGEAKWILGRKALPGPLNSAQKLWQCWKNLIPPHPQVYDAAISYIDGPPNYYVMEKVSAKKKVLWVHNEYQKLGYDPEFDRPYFEAADALVTISEKCRECLVQEFPELASRIHILENISSARDILDRAAAGTCPEFADTDGLKLLTVGRLNPQKGIDLAIGAAKKLKDSGVSFRWLVAGEGAERPALQERIDALGIGDCFFLMGARDNPYAYMARCDILVQSSRWEGKSIVLDEAKLLKKPIVVTNYGTVRDAVTHGQTGWITEMDADAICEGIRRLWQNPDLRKQLSANLHGQALGNESELEKYIRIML